MKQTKTRSVLMILTLALLVLTLGLGLLFLPKSTTASAEASLELVPLSDAELLASKTYSSRGEAGAAGVYWDARRSQLRLFFKVNGGDYGHTANTMGQNIYGSSDKIFLTVTV